MTVVVDAWCKANQINNYDILCGEEIVINIKRELRNDGMEHILQINTPPPYKLNIDVGMVIIKNFTPEFIPKLPREWNPGVSLMVYVGGLKRFPEDVSDMGEAIDVGDFSWFNSLGGGLTISGYYCRCKDVEINIPEHIECLKLIEINATIKNIETERLVLTHSTLKSLNYNGHIGEVDMEKSFLEKEINGKTRLINLNPQIWVKMNTNSKNRPRFRTGW